MSAKLELGAECVFVYVCDSLEIVPVNPLACALIEIDIDSEKRDVITSTSSGSISRTRNRG